MSTFLFGMIISALGLGIGILALYIEEKKNKILRQLYLLSSAVMSIGIIFVICSVIIKIIELYYLKKYL